MRILIVGHAFGPGFGSEPGITWNWALSLSKQHEVWVIAHPQDRERIEAYFEANPNPNLQVRFVTVRFDPWDPRKGESGLKLHYVLWLRAAFDEARHLHERVHFDLVHHVSLGTAATGSPFWRLDAPLVWGPVGGAQLTPTAFKPVFNGSWCQERLRAFQVGCLPYLPAVSSTAQRAKLVLASNEETRQLLLKAGADRVELFMDGGTEFQPYTPREPGAELQLLWAGRFEARKALPLLLYALADVDVPYRLRIAGSGPMESAWRELVDRMELTSRVFFLGRVAPERMIDLFRSSDLFAFTSVRDTFGTVVLEAMSNSLPILTLNHQGVGAFLPDAAAIKVPVKSLRGTIAGLATGVRYLAENPFAIPAMRRASWEFAQSNSWDQRAERMTRMYEEILHG